MSTVPTTKTCKKCNKRKYLYDFYKKGGGYDSWCKDCKKEQRKLRYGKSKKLENKHPKLVLNEPKSKIENSAIPKVNYNDINSVALESKRHSNINKGNLDMSSADFNSIVEVFNILAKWRDEKKEKEKQ